MQYISKAYNYYSGINPATLSGAIDVIVVRSVDADGEETLACSPFHVRFGKLRVLRVGEKRVTLSMPNNLPEPHIVPFSMKVSDTGEAFFVLETDDDVPADLLTSPVISATDAEMEMEAAAHRPSLEIPEGNNGEDMKQSLTLQPFGQTEQQVSHEGHTHDAHHDELPEVDHLDLNAKADDSGASPTQSGSVATPSSVLPPARKAAGDDGEIPNPLHAAPGEDTALPVRDYRLKNLHSDVSDVQLPKVKPGEHDGPRVQYGHDIVFDNAGYHKSSSSNGGATRGGDDTTPASPVASAFPRPKSPVGVKNPEVQELIADLMGYDMLASPLAGPSDDGLPASMAALSLEGGSGSTRASLAAAALRRSDRATSEPPAEISRPSSPSGGGAGGVDASEMDLAWDWGKGQEDGEHHDRVQPHRSESVPVGGGLSAANASRAVLKEVENDPYKVMLVVDGREHVFELSLCGDEKFAPDGEASDDEADEFGRERITFAKFMEDANIVDDPKLVIQYEGLYLSWTTGYHLLFALAIYRHSPPVEKSTKPAEPQRSSGYWSRWWRGTPRSDSLEPPAIERSQSAEVALTGNKDRLEVAGDAKLPASASLPVSEVPSPPGTPSPDAPVGEDGAALTEKAAAIAAEKHYAKTLRLSSDQLKQLQLKPGPNTINFSVMSSYSGYAVVSARIFLWEATDQVIISDIDGTITKSDALGHVFAAIGRDWTHVGIANLYTDICNNGYKILYLTARAIGQADTTRDYLKTVVQGDYRLPEGPVIMSPDRLMASLHREVILRKPELFKMACLRDIQRLFGKKYAKTAFFAGFGNRITDAMSYRSVGIESGKIYTIDTTGVIKTELLQGSHKGSYIGLNDLVNEVFPPVKTKFEPAYTDFNYWRDPIADIPIPELNLPPSPALSARSDTSGGSRLSYLGKIASLGRRSSRPVLPGDGTGTGGAASPSSRPSSPLIGPALTPGDLSDDDGWDSSSARRGSTERGRSRASSMPGSFEDGNAFPESWFKRGESMDSVGAGEDDGDMEEGENGGGAGSARRRRRRRHSGETESDEEDDDGDADSFADDDAIFDDDILATGEMARVPF